MDPLPSGEELGSQIDKILEHSEEQKKEKQSERKDGRTGPLFLSISQRLERKFGSGEDKAKRWKLYMKIQNCHKRSPDRVGELISEAVAESVGTRRPDRYFCVAILAKLREAGLDGRSAEDAQW